MVPPAPRKQSYKAYRFQRRLLDFDGSGNCVLMDFQIERLGGSDAVGMRSLEHRFERVVGGKWQPFETSLDYFPHAFKRRADGKVYLIDAPVNEATGDHLVARVSGPRVPTVIDWQQEAGFLPVLALQAEATKRAEVLRAGRAAAGGRQRCGRQERHRTRPRLHAGEGSGRGGR